MMRAAASIILIMLASPAAAAAHCPHGELYRVHLRECVRIGSRLALAIEQPRVRKAHESAHIAPTQASATKQTDAPTDLPLLGRVAAPSACPVPQLSYGSPWGALCGAQ